MSGGEKGSEFVDRWRLEYISQFKYSGFVLDESGPHGAECDRK